MTKESYGQEPEHLKNANGFISAVVKDIAPQFRGLSIIAINQTEDDINSFPGMIEAARLEGDTSLLDDLKRDDRDAERESARSTSVFVSITGDDRGSIQRATGIIHERARRFRGRNTNDSGINQSGVRSGLEKVIGHRPEHEDLPLLQRYLSYLFR